MGVGTQHTKSVIIVTDMYPPVAGVGVYRTIALSKHLAGRGWRVTVITARPQPGAFLDPAMLEKIPESVRIVRAPSPNLLLLAARVFGRRSAGRAAQPATPAPGAPPARPSHKGLVRKTIDWLSWWLHTPDTRSGWLLPALGAGLREAKRHRPDVIYSTAPAWTSHLVGAGLARLLRVPLVADFRDPWCGSAWHKVPYRTHQLFDNALEKFVVGQAQQITCAWDGIRRHLAARYPNRAGDIHTILNGYDPEEMQGVAPLRMDDGRCVLMHAGTFYGPRSPIPLLEGLQRLQENSPAAKALLVLLVGQPEYGGRPLADLARQHGVDSLVRVVPLVARREALAMLKGAHVALLFGQSGNEALASVPAKMYDYISAGMPVLAIGTGDEACDLMCRAGCRVWAVRAEDAAGIAAALGEIVSEYHQKHLGRGSEEAPQRAFYWSHTIARLASVLETVSNRARASDRCSLA